MLDVAAYVLRLMLDGEAASKLVIRRDARSTIVYVHLRSFIGCWMQSIAPAIDVMSMANGSTIVCIGWCARLL